MKRIITGFGLLDNTLNLMTDSDLWITGLLNNALDSNWLIVTCVVINVLYNKRNEEYFLVQIWYYYFSVMHKTLKSNDCTARIFLRISDQKQNNFQKE